MPKLKMSKEAIEGQPLLPEGMYIVRLDGFKPATASKGGSINLNPQMKIINHPEFNDRPVFENLNTKGDWVWKDFCHAFGVPIETDGNGSYVFPGDFNTPPGVDENDPKNWLPYVGPLLGQTGTLYLVQADNSKGGMKNAVKFYSCKIPGCTLKHSSNLVG
jgi:hypothetical protein